MQSQVHREGQRIIVQSDLTDYCFRGLLSELHKAVDDRGYSDLVLDFSQCTAAFANSMLGLCAQVLAYRNGGVDFELVPPAKTTLKNLFHNTNWAHLLDPRNFPPSNFKGHSRIPATQYKSPKEQHVAVNKIVNVVLGAIPEMRRADFAAFEWSVNEITDNVLVHADSPIGGLVQVSTFQKANKQVQFVVADPGRGIPSTLRIGRPEISSDTQALDEAIKEGVTRDRNVGQGNGLFGSYQICSYCGGAFGVMSGRANLVYGKAGLSIRNEHIPFSGTLVVSTIDFSKPKLLEEALRFGGRKHSPVDFVEMEYEGNGDGGITFRLQYESNSFGSRALSANIVDTPATLGISGGRWR